MRFPIVALTMIAAGLGQQSLAADFDAGHFVQTQCTRCHDSSVYTRPNRRIDSLTRLESQVRMCDANLETRMLDDEILAVVDFLNTQYYKFDD